MVCFFSFLVCVCVCAFLGGSKKLERSKQSRQMTNDLVRERIYVCVIFVFVSLCDFVFSSLVLSRKRAERAP